jgi:hypothetical protein
MKECEDGRPKLSYIASEEQTLLSEGLYIGLDGFYNSVLDFLKIDRVKEHLQDFIGGFVELRPQGLLFSIGISLHFFWSRFLLVFFLL